jgi:hypothetical protein
MEKIKCNDREVREILSSVKEATERTRNAETFCQLVTETLKMGRS